MAKDASNSSVTVLMMDVESVDSSVSYDVKPDIGRNGDDEDGADTAQNSCRTAAKRNWMNEHEIVAVVVVR